MAAYRENRIEFHEASDLPSVRLRSRVYEVWWMREQLRRLASKWLSVSSVSEVVPVILPKEGT